MTSGNQSDKKVIFMDVWLIFGSSELPEPEHKFCPSRRFRFDWAWVEKKVAVEVDGGVWLRHGGRHGMDKDREKLNIAASLGWLVLRFSVPMLQKEPDLCCQQVLLAMEHCKA